jgi:hypothetical protein
MAISTGGIIEEWGPPRQALQEVMKQVGSFAPRTSDQDHVVDVAFRSWHRHREPEFSGVHPGVVGRKQRRFIVWHSVPLGLDTPGAVRSWLVSMLPETSRLVREYLPTKPKSYPVEQLADQIDGLREVLSQERDSPK